MLLKLTLLISTLLFISCNNLSNELVSNVENASNKEDIIVLTGNQDDKSTIAGTVTDCFQKEVPFAELYVTLLPDDFVKMVESGQIPEYMAFFHDDDFYVTVMSDSLGGFQFKDIPIGIYQVGINTEYEGIACGKLAIDFVKVKPDSIAIVDISMMDNFIEIIQFVRIWHPLYISNSKD